MSRPITRRASPEKSRTPPQEAKPTSPEGEPEPIGAEGSEQELKRLMQQTDDAKVTILYQKKTLILIGLVSVVD